MMPEAKARTNYVRRDSAIELEKPEVLKEGRERSPKREELY